MDDAGDGGVVRKDPICCNLERRRRRGEHLREVAFLAIRRDAERKKEKRAQEVSLSLSSLTPLAHFSFREKMWRK